MTICKWLKRKANLWDGYFRPARKVKKKYSKMKLK